MRKKVRKSLAFLLALALVVSVMSGLGLSVSADDDQTTESVQTTDVEGKPAEKDALKNEGGSSEEEQSTEPVKEPENQDKPAGEGSSEAAKDTTADSNDEQKDESQAKPDAEEPAEPEEEPAASYLSTLSVEELYAYLTKLDDNNFAAAWKELTDSQKADYNAYVLKMAFGDNKATTSYEGGAGAKAMTQAAGLVESAAVSGSSLLRKSPARAAKEAATRLVTESKEPADGLVMKKTISKDTADTADTKYTIKLESYATGSETTTPVKTSKPCDIVLVLDQSGSMGDDMKKVTFTDKAFGADAKNITAYKYNSSLYVKANKVDSDQPVHIAVNLKRNVLKSEEIKTYKKVTNSLRDWYGKATDYYYLVEGEYCKVTKYGYDRSKRQYYLTYKKKNEDVIQRKDLGNDGYSWLTLYEESKTVVNNVYEYVYTYTDVDGNERKVTIEGNDSTIPTETTHSEFFAGTTDSKLYYSEAQSTDEKEQKLEALKKAARSFITSVENDKDGEGNVIDHNIAVVGFSSKSHTTLFGQTEYFHNTEILTGVKLTDDGTNGAEYYNYNGCKGDYNSAKGTALQSVRTNEGKNSIANAINALTANGATQTDHGIIMASDIFAAQTEARKAQYEGGDRNKVVIVFTDGSPTSGSAFEPNVANDAITKAKELKNGGATVYTIGIFDGANATLEAGVDGTSDENTFMHYVSSNFPNASSMTSSGTKAKDGYYLSATNSSELSQIFQSISQNIHGSTTSVQLDGTTQNIDKMSKDFQFRSGLIAEQIKKSIKVYTVPYTGKVNGEDTFDETKPTTLKDAGIEVNDDQVTVTGYSYKDEYIATVKDKPQGTKLVIEIPVEYKNDAWFGGNDIASNDIGSGIYNGGSCYGTFEVPKVNRAIDYEIAAKDQTIYVTNKADLTGLLDYFKTNGKKYEPNGTNNKYVDITYTLKQGNTVIGTYKIERGQNTGTWTLEKGQALDPALENCATYTWTCTVTPNDSDGMSLGVAGTGHDAAVETKFEDGKAKQGTVHVLYPTVNAKDEFIYWGETIDPDTLITVANDWTDQNSTHGKPNLIGDKPTITTEADFQAGKEGNTPSKDSDYNVIAKIGDRNITQLLREHDRIASARKAHDSCDDTSVGKELTDKDFRIHVKVKKLTVKKIVEGNMGDTNQDFTFTGGKIYDDSKNEVATGFTLKHNKSKTFKLKVNDTVSISETSVAGYETSYKVGNDSTNSYEYNYGKVTTNRPDEVTVIYTNKKQITPPNGIITTIAPYAIMVVLAAGAGVYFVYSRRRHNG